MTPSHPGSDPDAERAPAGDPYPAISAAAMEVLADERARARADLHEVIDLLDAERKRVADLKQKWQLAQSSAWQLRQLRGRALRPLRRLARGRPSEPS
ncbi:MAG: hypothetical protein RJQ01_01850 [Microcella sp.]|uniref:hypothetical protein n=1 Tax=Microcella sp. TaxID=1913979 RepID=UPI00331521B4